MQRFEASRSGPVITFSIPTSEYESLTVQLVLAHHKSVQDLMRNVDLDCTAIAFADGEELYFNSISKFCYENACAIVGESCNTPLFESRIAKYFTGKDVDIILPFLDMDKVPRKNLKYGVHEVIDLKQLAIVFGEIAPPRKIMTVSVLPTAAEDRAVVIGEGGGAAVDLRSSLLRGGGGKKGKKGGTYSAGSKTVKKFGVIIHENIIHLLHGYPEKFQFYGQGRFVKDVLSPLPKLTQRMITNSYETVKDKLDAFGYGSIDTRLLEKYFVVRSAAQIISDILVKPLLSKEESKVEEKSSASASSCGSSAAPSSADADVVAGAADDDDDDDDVCTTNDDGPYSALDKSHPKFVEGYFDDLIKLQIADTYAKLSALERDYAENPCKYSIVSALPFERVVVADWYGDKFIDNRAQCHQQQEEEQQKSANSKTE